MGLTVFFDTEFNNVRHNYICHRINYDGLFDPENYKPQVVLAAAGIFLMMCGVWLGFGGVLDPAKSSGYLIVDIYNEILRMLSNRIAGLGLSIMAVGGYARYMERIGQVARW